MAAVWDESSTQGHDMIAQVNENSPVDKPGFSNSTFQDMKNITINVIGSVGFGESRSFSGAASIKPPAGFKTTSIGSTLAIVDNLAAAVFVPAKLMTLPFMPRGAKQVGYAKTEFPRHLNESIAKERRSPSSKNSLITSLVKLADQDRSAAGKTSKTSTYLTEEEITGTLFVFTVAGFDTTANTLTYCILSLALNPEWQDWIIEGIDAVAETHPDGDYSTSFPLQTRCLALMVNQYFSKPNPLPQLTNYSTKPFAYSLRCQIFLA